MITVKKIFVPFFAALFSILLAFSIPTSVAAEVNRAQAFIDYVEDPCASNSFANYDEKGILDCQGYSLTELIPEVSRFLSILKAHNSNTYVASTTYDVSPLTNFDKPAQTEFIDFDIHKVNVEQKKLDFVATINSGAYNTFFGVSPNNKIYVLEALYDIGSNYAGAKISKLVNGSFQHYITIPKELINFKGAFYIDGLENIYLINGAPEYDVFNETKNSIVKINSSPSFSVISIGNGANENHKITGVLGDTQGRIYLSYADINLQDFTYEVGVKELQAAGSIIQFGNEAGFTTNFFEQGVGGFKSFITSNSKIRTVVKLDESFSQEYFEFTQGSNTEFESLNDLITVKYGDSEADDPKFGISNILDFGQGRFYTIGNLYHPTISPRVNAFYRLSRKNEAKLIFQTDRDFRVVQNDEDSLLIFKKIPNSTKYQVKILELEGEVEPNPEVGDAVPEDLSLCGQFKQPTTNFYAEMGGRFFNVKIQSNKLYMRSSADGIYGGVNSNSGLPDNKEMFDLVNTNKVKGDMTDVYLMKINNAPLSIVLKTPKGTWSLPMEMSGSTYDNWKKLNKLEAKKVDRLTSFCGITPIEFSKPPKGIVTPGS